MKENLPSLKLTFSHLKIDGWKTIVSFWVSFLVGAMLVSGRVILEIPSRERSHIPYHLALLSRWFSFSRWVGYVIVPRRELTPFPRKTMIMGERVSSSKNPSDTFFAVSKKKQVAMASHADSSDDHFIPPTRSPFLRSGAPKYAQDTWFL